MLSKPTGTFNTITQSRAPQTKADTFSEYKQGCIFKLSNDGFLHNKISTAYIYLTAITKKKLNKAFPVKMISRVQPRFLEFWGGAGGGEAGGKILRLCQ